MALRALLFDVDGTLADTERVGHRIAFNRAFHEMGFAWEWDESLYGELLAITGGKERILHYVQTYHPELIDDPFHDTIKELHRLKTAFFVKMLESGEIPLRPGVIRLIREAKEKGLLLAVATTTTPENVTTLLSSEHAKPIGPEWFDVIAAGDIVPKKKPDPGIYLYALEKLGIAPDEAIAFEDSRNGLLASMGAGLKTVITVNGYTAEENFDGAAAVLSDFGEPNAPCRVIRGPFAKEYVDVESLSSMVGSGTR